MLFIPTVFSAQMSPTIHSYHKMGSKTVHVFILNIVVEKELTKYIELLSKKLVGKVDSGVENSQTMLTK